MRIPIDNHLSLRQYIVMQNEVPVELERLLDEITNLAACLREVDRGEQRSSGLPPATRAVLSLLQRHPGLTVPQLARQRGTSRQNVQVQVDRLAHAGWVIYVDNPDHRRSGRLQLTSAGKRSLKLANQRQKAWLANLATPGSQEDLRLCCDVLAQLRSRMGGRSPIQPQPVRDLPETTKAPRSIEAVKAVAEPQMDKGSEIPPVEEFPVNLL